MQKYADSVIDSKGNAIPDASVRVNKASDGGVAAIYAKNGSVQLSNPMRANELGRFEFYAADGRYNLTILIGGVTYTTVDDILLEDPADPSSANINSGTIANVALSNVTIDGKSPATSSDLTTVYAQIEAKMSTATLASTSGATYVTTSNGQNVEVALSQKVQSAALSAPTGSRLISTPNGDSVEIALGKKVEASALLSGAGASAVGTVGGESVQQRFDALASAATGAGRVGHSDAVAYPPATVGSKLANLEARVSTYVNGTKIYTTKADLLADLTPVDKLIGIVEKDPVDANNGWYKKVGATNMGTWARMDYQPALVSTQIQLATSLIKTQNIIVNALAFS